MVIPYDITGIVKGLVEGSTLNTAIQKASGDKKSKFTYLIMHSAIATKTLKT